MGKVALRLRARAALRKQLPNRFDRPGLNTFRVGSAALGAEPRLRILRLLLAAHPTGMVVGEVQEELGIPASTLSHHLEKLKQVGLVHVRRESTYLWYSADTDALREVMNFLYEECCTRSRAVPAESVVQISGRTS